jgi:hypothetical protein
MYCTVTGGPADLVINTELVLKAPKRANSFAYLQRFSAFFLLFKCTSGLTVSLESTIVTGTVFTLILYFEKAPLHLPAAMINVRF